jgi:hypothetical protein
MKSKIALTTLFTLSAFLFVPQAGSKFTNLMPAASAEIPFPEIINNISSQIPSPSRSCNNSLLKGTYIVNLTGWVTNGSERVPYALVANVVADGKGLAEGTSTVSLDGVISSQPLIGAYTVNPDCTGIGTSEQAGSFQFVISPDGSKAINIITSPSATITGTSERVSR